MNPIIFILLCFAALGLFDKMFKNRLGLATSFDRGIITMGDFMMSVGGFYCIAIAFLNGHATLFKNNDYFEFVGARSWRLFHYRVYDTF